MGAALDPESSIFYVSSISYTSIVGLVKPDPSRSNMDYVVSERGVAGPSGLKLFKPPYNRITAIDMKTGTHAWMTPMGGPMGGGERAFPLATKTLLIAAQGEKVFAMDKATGNFISEVRLRNARGEGLGLVTGAPMTYMHEGKQYIAMALTERSGNRRQHIIALALP
jgi:quinoprotein glucose dehydrogenase